MLLCDDNDADFLCPSQDMTVYICIADDRTQRSSFSIPSLEETSYSIHCLISPLMEHIWETLLRQLQIQTSCI